MQELTDPIHSLANGKAVGPDGVPVELFKIALNGDPALRQRLLDIVIWRGGDVPKQWKDAIMKVLHEKKDRTECGNYGLPACSPKKGKENQRVQSNSAKIQLI